MEFTEYPSSLLLALLVIGILAVLIIIILTQTDFGRVFCLAFASRIEAFFVGFKPFTQACKIAVD